MKIQGRAHTYGDNIDTDIIIPARYLVSADPQILAKHAMEGIDKNFSKNVKAGDILVVGENFGCGSSREHAPLALQGTGIACIIAKSFARIFYRNSINIGLAIFECPEAVVAIEDGDRILVDLEQGIIRNLRTGEAFEAVIFSPEMQAMIKAGGLLAMIRQQGDLR